MKKFRNPILARAVLLYFFISMGVGTRQAHAQFVVADLIQDINTVIQTASQAAIQVADISNALQHSKFYDYLKAISSGVKTYKKVQEIIESEKRILASAQTNLNALRNNPYLTPTQIAGMIKMYKYFVEQSAKNAKELAKLLNPATFQMSDSERIGVIDRIDVEVKELDHLMNYYNLRNLTLTSQQQLALLDMEKVNTFYAAQVAPKETTAGATAKIGGFYGQIVNLLYGISAIVALIGALKIYGQWTRGDEGIFQTAGSWFGAVLLSVIITTFIKILYF